MSDNDITDKLSKWGDWLHNRKRLEKMTVTKLKALAKNEGVGKYYKMSKTELLNVLTPTPPKMPSNVINLYKDVISNREADNLDIIKFIPIEKAFNNSYRRYRVNAIMKIGVEPFLNKTRKNLKI